MTSSSGRLHATAYIAAHQALADPKATRQEKEEAERLLAPTKGPQIGDHVLIRTVTLYQAGTIVNITGDANDGWITLTDAVSVREAGETSSFWRKDQPWKSAEAYAPGALVHVARGPIIEICRVERKAAQ
jgi:hypothetical protein